VNLLRLHPGLRLSAAGGVVFLLGLLSLLLLPAAIAVAVMIAGGMGVWSGFLWTLFSWYGPTSNGDTPT
jgi:hypothetical protein